LHFNDDSDLAMFSSSTNPFATIIFVLIACTAPVVLCFSVGAADPRNDVELSLAANPHNVLGYESCEKCHTNEVAVWKRTPHSETFFTLHRQPEAQEIASRLGVRSFKTDAACVKCHYTMQSNQHGLDAISGVSCESCHGGAKDWITLHNDYGGSSTTKEQESTAHRQQRLVQSVRAGMKNPMNVYMVAQSCYGCHTVPDEALVNVGGHNAGSLDFELVSWSQGTVRHNFLRTDGQSNAMESPEKLNLMFVCGMIADLEYSLRATAVATENKTFGKTSAQRTARAAKRLASVNAKVNQPILKQILEIFQSVELRLNNADPLVAAANEIRGLGLKFAGTTDGRDLAAIADFVPDASRWK
jgi:hypothetical protein